MTSTLVKYVKRDGENLKKSIIFIAQADNMEGAKELKKALKGMCKAERETPWHKYSHSKKPTRPSRLFCLRQSLLK